MRKLCLTISAATLLPAFGGCASSSVAPLARDIGPPPAYLAQVPNPEPRPKESALTHAAERGAALDKANAIIACTDAEWRATRVTLLAGERPVDAAAAGECAALDQAMAKAKPRSRWRKST